jgi:hypothetical protein
MRWKETVTFASIATRGLLANIDPRDFEVLQEQVHIAIFLGYSNPPGSRNDGELVVWANGGFVISNEEDVCHSADRST